ncbi:hypothetical protein [Paraburkholderia sp. GAS32]|uniref:hypothetical protein n=1 Tax=Paraburkholderia sp. GAS32 TaxID=3035129 RepID=UPI003D23206B
MSAKKAAEALYTFDADARELIDALFADRPHYAVPNEEKQHAIRTIAGTWTLSLAAAAAGVSETDALIAIAHRYLHCGTIPASRSTVQLAMTATV